MNISRERLVAEATGLSFRPEILEKVARLLSLLEAVGRHPRLKGRLALKGGTALNLFFFDVPRLSVDIDLNYVGAVDRESMLAERPEIERGVEVVGQAEGMSVVRVPDDHAGGKWRFRYQSALGQAGSLEIDLNFMYRAPLWPVRMLDSRPLGRFAASGIPVLDLHEIAAGKFAALLSRRAGRDLFDAHALLARKDFDDRRLRTAFVAFGAMNRVDWRTVSPASIGFEVTELREQLLPLLRSTPFRGDRELEAWADGLITECRQGLARLFPFTAREREFLDRLLDHGEIRPELLTDDERLARQLSQHPLLAWKAQNVKKHFGR